MTMADTVRTRHLISGQIAEVPVEIFEHADLGPWLEEVADDAKPYVPGFYAPREPGTEEVVGYDEFDSDLDEYFDIDPDKED